MNVTIPCVCPPLEDGQARHQSDVVTLRDKMPFRDALAMRYEIGVAKEEDPDITGADMLGILSESYIVHGIESWSLQQDGPKGKPEPIRVSRANIASFVLGNMEVGLILSEVADDLYAAAVMLPLIQAGSPSSPDSPTETTTSATTPPSKRAPKRSKRSSITTIQTDVIATTSPLRDGDSNLSPNSASAA